MSNMTSEEYYQKVKNDFEIITPVHCKHYGDLRAKEAVKEFAEELIAAINADEFDILIPISQIKFYAQQKGIKL